MNLLDKYNINPYEYLEIEELSDLDTIKRAYKEKARVLHPDKNNGKTDAQFKLLQLCYNYAKKNLINTPVKTFQELKSQDDDLSFAPKTGFHDFDFNNPEDRRRLFADDEIDFHSFEVQMNKVKGLPTTYTAENFYKKEILDKMKRNGKFDIDKFNAFFLKLKKQGKVTDLVKVEKVKAYNDTNNYVKVNVYDDMVINSKDDMKTSAGDGFISQKDVDELLQTDMSEIDKLIKEHKKDTGKITKKKMKELQQKKAQPVAVNHKKTFDEMEKEMENIQISEIKKQKENQKILVNKNAHIYQKRLPQFIN